MVDKSFINLQVIYLPLSLCKSYSRTERVVCIDWRWLHGSVHDWVQQAWMIAEQRRNSWVTSTHVQWFKCLCCCSAYYFTMVEVGYAPQLMCDLSYRGPTRYKTYILLCTCHNSFKEEYTELRSHLYQMIHAWSIEPCLPFTCTCHFLSNLIVTRIVFLTC